MSEEATPGATPTAVPPTATVTVPSVTPVAPQQGATPTTPTPDTAARIQELESQLGSANARIRELNRESKDHRLKAEALESVSATLTELGIKPEELKATIESGKAAITERDTLAQEKVLSDAAGVLKLQGNALFKSLLKDVAVKVEGEGDVRKVTVTGADGKAVDFEEYAKTRPELVEALPALRANGQIGQQQVTVPVMGVGGAAPAAKSFEQQKKEKMQQSEYPTF